MTTSLWENLKEVICQQNVKFNEENKNETRYQKQVNHIEVPFENDQFRGIITHFGNGKAKQAFDNGTINITAASFHSDILRPSKSLVYENDYEYYHSLDTNNRSQEGHTEWLCVDFKERKVKPSHYSIKSYGCCHSLQNWVLEGSNDGQSWDVLDTRNNEKSLNGSNSLNTFEITKSNEKDKFYQYLRIRQTGVNTSNNYKLIIRSLEYFGIIEEPK